MGKFLVVCQKLIQPLAITVESSKGDGTKYTVVTPTLYNDGVCTCPGFTHRGYCRHLEELETCDWYSRDDAYHRCPECNGPTSILEVEPTYDEEDNS